LDLLESAMMREAVDAEPGLPRLVAVARGYRNHAHSGRDYYDLFMLHATVGPNEPPGSTRERGIALIRRFENEIRRAIDLGHVADVDPEAAIFALWSTVHGFVSLELNGSFDALMASREGREEMYLRFVEATLRGLAPATSRDTGG
jgi:AcrR family transcriptional regulator